MPRAAANLLEAFVGLHPGSSDARILFRFVAVLAALLGCVHWGGVLRWGDIPWSAEDWSKELLYLNILKDFASGGPPPWNVDVAIQGTPHFLAIPETMLAPHFLLLRWLPTGSFAVVHVLTFFLIGWAGCIALARRYGLSPASLSALFLLLLFNGHIVAHLCVGHFMWTACFLLPWFANANFRMAEAEPEERFRWSGAVAFVLFAMILLGGFHLATWCCLFLLLQTFTVGRSALAAVLLGLGAGAVRYAPAGIALAGKDHFFVSGYPTLRHVWDATTQIRLPSDPPFHSLYGDVFWWEFDLFVDLTGVLLLALFGVWLRLRRDPPSKLDGPMAAMALLSLSGVYAVVAFLPIPLLNAERVSSRFLIVPFTILAVHSVREMALRAESLFRSRTSQIVLAGLIFHMAWAFANHSWNWNVARIASSPHTMGYPEQANVLPLDDGRLVAAFVAGSAVSAASLVAAAVLCFRNAEAVKPR